MECDDESGKNLSIRLIPWKLMLMNVFREERALRLLMEDTKNRHYYTYSHLEDSLCKMRRERISWTLDLDGPDGESHVWKIETMGCLWGLHTLFGFHRDYIDVDHAERNAAQTLILLRSEAAMSFCECSKSSKAISCSMSGSKTCSIH